MSRPTWITAAGNIGTIHELEFFETALEVYEPTGATVTYTFLSGELPPGIQVVKSGILQGVPVVLDPISVDESRVYNFTIRATAHRTDGNVVVDRSFYITVTNVVPPIIEPRVENLGTVFDGRPYTYQLQAIEENPSANLVWTMTAGQLPPGLTMTSSGLISGYIGLQPAEYDAGDKGYDTTNEIDPTIKQPYDKFPYDYSGRARNKVYTFQVQVSDGANLDTFTYSLNVIAKDLYTTDSTLNIVNNDYTTVDCDNRYIPIITTPSGSIGSVRQNNNFAFKFDAIDFEDDVINWTISLADGSGFDQLGVGYDTALFDQSASKLPPKLTMDVDTGWLHGVLDPQIETEKTYNFIIYAYKRDNPSYLSKSVSYSINVLGSASDQITWITPSDLGTINNGHISELSVQATSVIGKDLVYSLTPGVKQSLPQGLELLPTGLISGRASFRHFTLDNSNTTFDKNKTHFDNLYTFSVLAEIFINAGSSFPAHPSIGEYAIRTDQNPMGLYIYNGTSWVWPTNELTGLPASVIVSAGLPDIANENDYLIEPIGDKYRVYKYASGAWATINVASSRTFTVRINNTHQLPFENLYLKALLTLDQRALFQSIVARQDIFPDELVYRADDPWFGKAKDVKFLEFAGVHPSSLSEYANAVTRNHYNKRINFGQVKTAIATDEFYNTKYEVVYVEVVDPEDPTDANVREVVDLTGTINPYLEYNKSTPNNLTDTNSYSVVYPNTFDNMEHQIKTNLGYSARGMFPDWMTSVQPDKTVLGFTRAVVLAYTVPGASKLIAYRLKNNNIQFDRINFTADRYQLDNSLSANFNVNTDKFISSRETTFDHLSLGAGNLDGGVVNYAVNTAFDQINSRTIEYINANGGIDGVTSYSSGDLLVFAQQENYFNNTSPNDGWNNYKDLWIGNLTGDNDTEGYFDDYPFDDYNVVPGYLEKQQNILNTLLTATTSSGDSHLYIPYTVGADYIGKSVLAFSGLQPNTYITDQVGVNIVVSGDTMFVTRLTINQPVTTDMTFGSTITIKSSVLVASDTSTNKITVNAAPVDLLSGSSLSGDGIPDNTYVLDVVGNVITVNNPVSLQAGDIVNYAITNQRAGVWKISITDNVVTLKFQHEIQLGQKIKVLDGRTYGFTFLTYDPVLQIGQSVPAYSRWNANDSTKTSVYTTFDGNGTRFFDSRDNYAEPETGDKYIKFPQIGVFT